MLTRRQFLKYMLIGGTAGAVAVYPILIERYLIQVNHYDIPVRNLPEAFDGFTIVHLSDIHYSSMMPALVVRRLVEKVNAMPKDLIVNTGDNVYKRHSADVVDEAWSLLNELDAPYGVYSVLGNHDHWADTDQSIYWLEKSGQGLRHRAVALERANSRIWLGGAGDLWEDELGIDKAFSDTPEGECKILLAHNPDTADRNYHTRVDLFLCGHTHGGQVVLPFIGAPVLPVNNKRYVSGFIRSEKKDLFISRGVGTTAPIRVNCYPEIAVLKLTQES